MRFENEIAIFKFHRDSCHKILEGKSASEIIKAIKLTP